MGHFQRVTREGWLEQVPCARDGHAVRDGESLSWNLPSVPLGLCVSEAVWDGGKDRHPAAGSPHWMGTWACGQVFPIRAGAREEGNNIIHA